LISKVQFSIGAGLGGGVKYSFARYGTFYFDMSIDYIIFSQQSNNFTLLKVYPVTGERQWSPLIFSVSLGYRKDILW
jgi:outer membrane protein W